MTNEQINKDHKTIKRIVQREDMLQTRQAVKVMGQLDKNGAANKNSQQNTKHIQQDQQTLKYNCDKHLIPGSSPFTGNLPMVFSLLGIVTVPGLG